MGSVPKRQKLDEEGKNKETEDRISNLPSSIICHILSFLPTKYAVGTSILSTKWKQHWTSITNLDFDDGLLSHRQPSNSKLWVQKSFMNFVYRVLLLLKVSHVHEFRLKCDPDYEIAHVNAWVSAALSRDVRELDISISIEESDMLPRDLFICKTLVVLKLGSHFVLRVPTSVFLQNLKVLHLNSIEFLDDESTYRLFSSCPVLEDLAILGCGGWENITVLNISAPTLKTLIIDCLTGNSYSTEFCNYRIELNTPRLLYLKYFDYVARSYSVRNLPSLVEAAIGCRESAHEHNDLHDSAAGELLEGICHVKSLYWSGDSMQSIQLCWDIEQPVFRNLTCLKLGFIKDCSWSELPWFLESIPRLETLVFEEGLLHHVHDENDDNSLDWFTILRVPSCFSSRLKVISVKKFKGRKVELKLVKYFLKVAKVLKKLEIYTNTITDPREELKVTKELLTLPRRSVACQVVVP